jgi:hypothetical protein
VERQRRKRKPEGANGSGPGPHLGGIPRAAQERARRGPGGERRGKDSAKNENQKERTGPGQDRIWAASHGPHRSGPGAGRAAGQTDKTVPLPGQSRSRERRGGTQVRGFTPDNRRASLKNNNPPRRWLGGPVTMQANKRGRGRCGGAQHAALDGERRRSLRYPVTDGTGGTLAKQYETTNSKGARPDEQQEQTNLLLFVKDYV